MDPAIEQRPWLSRLLGPHPSLTIAAMAIAGVVLALGLGRPASHTLQLKCYFKDAAGLRAGAQVRLAGVEVGRVISVRVRPELRENPAEVIMLLQTPYELRVPNDSVVILQSAGVLGEVFPEIDIRDASGPPIANGGVLKTVPTMAVSPQELMDCFFQRVSGKPCDLGKRAPDADSSQPPGPERR